MRVRREAWSRRGIKRPDFAVEPGPGLESVWDYPRPPVLVPDTRLVEVREHTFCEWEGESDYFTLASGYASGQRVAWSYTRSFEAFTAIAGWFGFNPGRVECYVSGERVSARKGGFYGGWVTREVVGPFKWGGWEPWLVMKGEFARLAMFCFVQHPGSDHATVTCIFEFGTEPGLGIAS